MKHLKALKTKKGRDDAGQFIIEGIKFVNEIPRDWEVIEYVVAAQFASAQDLTAYQQRATCTVVRNSIFESMSSTVSPQGILAVCKQKTWQLENLICDTAPPFILLGENLNDPGNIGALIRTAAAAGAGGVILTTGSGDVYNPKVQRAAAGAALRLPFVCEISMQDAAQWLSSHGIPLYAAHPRGSVTPYNLDLAGPFCLLVGNESHGISDTAAALATNFVSLPMVNSTESLNASVAGSILLYEALRQRLRGQ